MKRVVLFAFPVLILIFGVAGIHGQKIEKCLVRKDKTIPKHRIDSWERGTGALILHISLNANDINEANLIRLSARLKMIYCKEQEIVATFFDSPEAAQNATLDSMSVNFERTLESSRAGYFLNRATGEEFVSYSQSSGYLRRKNDKELVKIVLGKDFANQQNQ